MHLFRRGEQRTKRALDVALSLMLISLTTRTKRVGPAKCTQQAIFLQNALAPPLDPPKLMVQAYGIQQRDSARFPMSTAAMN
jgi:hypothetical protein